MINLLIVAHGSLGESLVQCAHHMLGDALPGLYTFPVSNDDDPDDLLPQLRQLVTKINQHGVLVFSDICGATPSNLARKLVMPDQVAVLVGVNLPMLVKALSYRHESLPELVKKVTLAGRQGILEFTGQEE